MSRSIASPHTTSQLACFLAGLTMMAAPAVAESGESYADVLTALQGGKPVTLILDLGSCAVAGTGKSGPPLKGGLQIKAFMITPAKGLLFSDVHQTLDGADQPVTEYIRYNLGNDGQLTLAVTRQTTAGMTKQDTLVCQLSVGAKFFW